MGKTHKSLFTMGINFGFNVVWSNKMWLIPMDKIKKEGKFIGLTNRFNHFTYRLKPFIKIKLKDVNK